MIEAYGLLMDYYEKAVKNTQYSDLLNHYKGEFKQEVTCSKCANSKISYADFVNLEATFED